MQRATFWKLKSVYRKVKTVGMKKTHTSCDTMDGVVNESVRRVHLTPRLAVGALEGVLALKGGAASRITHVAMDASRQQIGPQASKPAKLTGVNLSGDVGSHVDCWITILRNIVLRHGITARGDCDLDVPVYGLASHGRRAQARVDRGVLGSALVLDSFVLQASNVAVGP